MTASLDDLAVLIGGSYPSATVTLTRYPSGSAMLDVVCDGRLSVLETRPGEGYGLSLDVPDDEGFLGGHGASFADLTSAATALLNHLTHRLSAPNAAPGTTRRVSVP